MTVTDTERANTDPTITTGDADEALHGSLDGLRECVAAQTRDEQQKNQEDTLHKICYLASRSYSRSRR